MGRYDDLIPAGGNKQVQSVSTGRYDDLVPAPEDNLAVQFGKGFHDAAASVLGLPVDAVETVLNMGIHGYNQATGSEIPKFNKSIGGSERIQDLTEAPDPQTTAGTVARVGGMIPVAAVAGARMIANQAPAAATSLGRIGQGLKTGALVGVAEGGIFSEAETPEEKLKDMGLSGLVGGGTGLVTGVVGAAINARKSAVAQGLDVRTADMMENASTVDRKAGLEMLDIVEDSQKSKIYSVTNRPSDVVGRTVMNRFEFIRKANIRAGRAIDRAADTLRGFTVDHAPVIDDFINNLDGAGVRVTQNADGSITPKFSGSDYEGFKSAEDVIRRVIYRMSDTKAPKAYDIHRLKRYIDNNVTYGKVEGGLVGDAERIVKSLRRDLDELLDSASPAYDRANTAYAETIRVIKDLEKAAGSKIDLSEPSSYKAMGTLSRRILSNANSRIEVFDTFEDLQKVAVSQGGKFDDDIITQVALMDDIDKMFGTNATTSLRGEVGKAGTDLGADVALGNKTMAGMTVEGLKAVADTTLGVNPENQMRTMRLLLGGK